MTDREILQHVKNNQCQLAVKGLYNTLPNVQNYIIANSGTRQDAQDIFQDALVILYRKTQDENWQLTSSLSTYLFAIAKNCWQAELRQRNKLPTTDISSDHEDAAKPDEQNYILGKKAFASLGEKCKELLILFYYRKLSFREIARTLGFGDERTAKNQKYRCLQKAKELYSNLLKKNRRE